MHSTSTVLSAPYPLNLKLQTSSLKWGTSTLKRGTVPQDEVADVPVEENQQHTNDATQNQVDDRHDDQPDLPPLKVRNDVRIARRDIFTITKSHKGIDNIPDTSSRSIDHEQLNNADQKPGNTGDNLAALHLQSDRSGTGDVFASVILGSMMCGRSFGDAVRAAIAFVTETVTRAEGMGIPPTDGLPIEETLSRLWS